MEMRRLIFVGWITWTVSFLFQLFAVFVVEPLIPVGTPPSNLVQNIIQAIYFPFVPIVSKFIPTTYQTFGNVRLATLSIGVGMAIYSVVISLIISVLDSLIYEYRCRNRHGR